MKTVDGHLEIEKRDIFALLMGAIALLIMLSGCGLKHQVQSILPVETETKQGETITKIEPKKTGERMDVPVGVKPSEVVAKIETKTGGKLWIVKKKKLLTTKTEVYENKQAVKEGIKIDKPKKSYAWLWWTGGIIGGIIVLLVGADFAIRRFLGFNPVAWLGERIFKRRKA